MTVSSAVCLATRIFLVIARFSSASSETLQQNIVEMRVACGCPVNENGTVESHYNARRSHPWLQPDLHLPRSLHDLRSRFPTPAEVSDRGFRVSLLVHVHRVRQRLEKNDIFFPVRFLPNPEATFETEEDRRVGSKCCRLTDCTAVRRVAGGDRCSGPTHETGGSYHHEPI